MTTPSTVSTTPSLTPSATYHADSFPCFRPFADMQHATLANGANLYLAPMSGSSKFYVHVGIPVGSRDEQPHEEGITHFLEHMMCAGTERRKSGVEIDAVIRDVGGYRNAYTFKHTTTYVTAVPAERAELALDLLADQLFHSTITDEATEVQRRVILEELNEGRGNPNSLAIDLVFSTIFGRSPLAHSVLGTLETVSRTSAQDLRSFRNQHIHPENMNIVIAGQLPPNIRTLTERFFAAYPRATETCIPAGPSSWTPSNEALRLAVLEIPTPSVALRIVFPGITENDPRRHALRVLNHIFGGSLGSRLNSTIREKEGLTYGINCGAGLWSDVGFVAIDATCRPQNVAPLLASVKREITKLCEDGISDEELRITNQTMVGNQTMGFETADSVAAAIAGEALRTSNKGIVLPWENLEKLCAVSKRDVLDLARSIFSIDKARLIAVGPISAAQIPW